MQEITFDFCVAGRVAGRLEEVSNRMNRDVLPSYDDIIQELSESWEGDAGGRFCALAWQESVSLKQTSARLKLARDCMQEAVMIAGQAEEKAKEIARQRKC